MSRRQNKVSLWLGNFESQEMMSEFVREIFGEDGNLYSDFSRAFEISFVDNQFLETYFSNDLSKNSLNRFSYSSSYIDEIDVEIEKYNGVIALYNYSYSRRVLKTDRVCFIGVYDYIEAIA